MCRLGLDLVPQSCFFKNLRSELCASDWNTLRREAYAAAGYKCEICGGRGKQHPVEAHEVWSYDSATAVQKLTGILCLCPDCHMVKHFGLAQMRGLEAKARKHLAKINDWSLRQVEAHLTEAFDEWRARSQISWTLDITWLDDKGIYPKRK